MKMNSYSTAMHLIGEQIIPNYMGMQGLTADRHILLASDRTLGISKRLKELVKDLGCQVDICEIPAYDIPTAARLIREALGSEVPDSVAWNMTGGTKPMFAAAFAVAAKLKKPGHEVYYLNTDTRSLDKLAGDFSHGEMMPCINSIDLFIQLAGYPVAEPGKTHEDPLIAERKGLIHDVWNCRGAIGSLMPQLMQLGNSGKAVESTITTRNGKTSISFSKDGRVEIDLFGRKHMLGPEHKGLNLLTGGWLEEFVYWKLMPLKNSGRLKDLRLGVKPAWRGEDAKAGTAQDFDVAATDGYKLYIFECKLYKPGQDEIQKLENITRQFGGHFGRGILVCLGSKLGAAARRVESSTNIGMIAGDALEGLDARCLDSDAGFVVTRHG